MAASLVHDVSEFCNVQGSAVYLCSQDVEGAFDNIPFPVLFHCASNVLPDLCWRVMYYWYSQMRIYVSWNNHLGPSIKVQLGTRQGCLTSPLLFNAFYQELVDKLSECKTGININGRTYNVFVYADDLLLASLTTTGLQDLINIAVSHITDRGLKFNPQKTVCMTYGKSHFTCPPHWEINNVGLAVKHRLDYLGTVLSKDNGKEHASSRIKSSN